MPKPRSLFCGRKTLRTKRPGPAQPDRKPSPKSILCVLPRRLRENLLKPLLSGYDLTVANTWAGLLGLARRHPHDLYVVYTPLGWADAAEVCQRVRAVDQATPLIVYAMRPSADEREDALRAGAQAYVARSEDVHNLAGTAGQLMMLAELRSLEAMTAGAEAMEDTIVRRLSRVRNRRGSQGVLQPKAQDRLKIHARRMFASAGGSPAHFERVWPSLYDSAIERLGRSDA